MDNFDVRMGAYDSAKVADLIGIYILDTMGHIVNLEQVELYRNDRIIKFGLVFWFNEISTFLGYLMPKPSFEKNSSGTI